MRISDWSSDVCSSDLPTAKAYARLSGSRSIAVPLRPGRTACAPRHPLAIRIDRPLRAPATPTARIRGAHGGWHTKNPAEAGLVSLNATANRTVAALLLQVLQALLLVDRAPCSEIGRAPCRERVGQ